MLGLYLDTLLVNIKVSSTLNILNELTSQKELQNYMFLDNKKHNNNKTKSEHKNRFQSR